MITHKDRTQRNVSAFRQRNSPVKITVYPGLTTQIDQKVDITVNNLNPEENIMLRARTIDDSKMTFESLAKYKADNNGVVSVSSQPSLGGTYDGVEPMGLFWSMRPVVEPDKDNLLRKRDVTIPMKIEIAVCGESYQSGTKDEDIHTRITLHRCFMGIGVTRCFIEGNGFYGTLFLPPGDGPFPGVIDLWGLPGGIREDRAALMASNGFASLALAFWGFKDLPEKYTPLHLSYFEKVVDWLSGHPKVMSGGVGLLGLSMGGVLALGIASQIPQKIKAVVSISAAHVLVGCTLKCKSMNIEGYPVDLIDGNYVCYLHLLSIYKNRAVRKPNSPAIIPVEKITCPLLLVYGKADELNPGIEEMCEEVYQCLKKHGKESLCKRLGLPGTGHFLTPCYMPPCFRHYVKTYDEVWFLGGKYETQGKALEIFWKESLEFLRENIGSS